jgi:hypothetical protein
VQQAGLAVCALDVCQLEQGVQLKASGSTALGALRDGEDASQGQCMFVCGQHSLVS